MLTVAGNQPPVAGFSWLPSAPWATETVVFQDRSSDPDGEVVAWEWIFGDGESSREQAPSHPYAFPGEYRVTLRVRDNDGAWAEAERTLQVTLASYILGTPAEAPRPNLFLVWVAPGDRDKLREGTAVEAFRRRIGPLGVFDLVVGRGQVVAVLDPEHVVVELRAMLPEPVRPGLFVRPAPTS